MHIQIANKHTKKILYITCHQSIQIKTIRHFCVSLRREEFCSSNGVEFLPVASSSKSPHICWLGSINIYLFKIDEKCLLVCKDSWKHSILWKESCDVATFYAVFMVNVSEIEASIDDQTEEGLSIMIFAKSWNYL